MSDPRPRSLSFHMVSETLNRRAAAGPSTTALQDNPKHLTRRRGACGSCKMRKVRCDGRRPCVQCQKLSRECVYTQTRPARRAGQGHSISSQDSMTDLTNSRESEHAPTLDRSLSSPRPFHEYQWSLPDLMTDNSWEQSDIPNANLAEFEKVLMDFSPSGVTGLTVPPNHTSCDIPSPTSQLGIFGGTCGSSNSNTFSSEFLDDPIHGYQRSESTQQTMVQPTYTHGEYRNEVLIRDFSGNRDAWESGAIDLLRPSETIPPNEMAATPKTQSYLGLGLFMIDDDILKADIMLGAFSSFAQLEPRQYEQTQVPDADLNESTILSCSQLILDDFLEACFEDPTGLASFTSLILLKRILAAFLEDQSASPVHTALLYAAIAIGCHSRTAAKGKEDDSSSSFFQRSLSLLGEVLLAKDSLLKLQSLVIMTIYARIFGLRCFRALITNAVSCVQHLRLYQKSGIFALTSDSEEQAWAMRTFWYLYTLTQPYCLRWGLQPAIDDAYIDLNIPNPLKPTSIKFFATDDYLSLQLRYAKVCTQIIKAYHDKKTFAKPLTAFERIIDFLHQQLDAWISEIPDKWWSGYIPHPDQALLALDSLFLYHRNTHPEDRSEHRGHGLKRCVQISKDLLKDYDDLQIVDFLSNRALAFPLFAAVQIIFLAVALKWSDEEERSYLAMACGLFGRLSIRFKVPLAEVIELNSVAQRVPPTHRIRDKPSLVWELN